MLAGVPLPVQMVPLLLAGEAARRQRDGWCPQGSQPGTGRGTFPVPGCYRLGSYAPEPARLHDHFFRASDADDPATMQRARDLVWGALEFNIGQAGTAQVIRNTYEAAQRTEPGAVQAWRALRRAYSERKATPR